jgi:hypothetical protein
MMVAAATDIRSFISLALALEQPKTTISASCAEEGPFRGKSIDVEFDQEKALSKKQFSSIDQLVKKYQSIKDCIDLAQPHEALNAGNCSPIVTFKPSTKYEIIEVSGEQLSLAKGVAQRVVKVHDLHTGGDHRTAKSEYEELQSYVRSKRDTFLGQFRNVRDLNVAVGVRGVGTGVRADTDCTGAVIFVIIEIFIV